MYVLYLVDFDGGRIGTTLNFWLADSFHEIDKQRKKVMSNTAYNRPWEERRALTDYRDEPVCIPKLAGNTIHTNVSYGRFYILYVTKEEILDM